MNIFPGLARLATALRDPLFRDLAVIDIALNWAINYELPQSTFKDHWNDCLGFMVTL